MNSMTGYGRAEAYLPEAGITFSVEVSSVNRRQNEVVVNAPRDFAQLETALRDVVRNRVSRGRTVLTIGAAAGSSEAARAHVDAELARIYRDQFLQLKEKLNLAGELDLNTILQAPGVLSPAAQNLDMETTRQVLETATTQAMDQLLAMRAKEGQFLASDIAHRIEQLRGHVEEISQLAPRSAQRYRENLMERLRAAELDIAPDDERVMKEVMIFADRSDISEEITRLKSHFEQFEQVLTAEEPVGRKLDFMVQELVREFNTLGAKGNDAEISRLVVQCKTEVEKIREQAQNIE